MQTTIQTALRLSATVAAALLLLALPAATHAAQAPKATSVAAAPLAQGAGYQLPHGSQRVRMLQLRLRSLGEQPGPIDGRFGPLTKAAVTRFQQRQGLTPDGIVGPQTRSALVRPTRVLTLGAGYGKPRGEARVRKLQRSLRLAGEQTGPIDGRFGPLTEAAVIRFQQRHGLAADGVVGEATTVILTRETTQRTRVGRTHRSARNRSSSNTANRQPLNDTAATGGSGSMFSTGGLASLALGLMLGIVVSFLVRRDRTTRTPRAGTGRAAPVLPRVIARRPEAPSAKGPRVLGYATVRPDAGEGRRDDLKAQLAAIHNECRRRGLELVDVVREHEPERAKGLERPGLGYALRRIAHGDARGLVIADLWRVSRSVTDVGEVLEWFSRTGTRLVAAEPPLDTGEHEGRLAATALMNVSSAERERLSERTRKGLEAAKRQQTQRGRAAVADDPELSEHIARMRSEGMTLQAIADRLNEEGVPTIRGGVKWRPSSVQAALGYRRPRSAPGGPRMEFGGTNNGEGGASM